MSKVKMKRIVIDAVAHSVLFVCLKLLMMPAVSNMQNCIARPDEVETPPAEILHEDDRDESAERWQGQSCQCSSRSFDGRRIRSAGRTRQQKR